jgi:hypothetical protein
MIRVFLLAFLFLLSCSKQNCKIPNITSENREVFGNDLTSNFYGLDSKLKFIDFLKLNKNISKNFFEINEQEDSTKKINQLYSLLSNEYYDSLYLTVKNDFPKLSTVFNELNLALSNYNKSSQTKRNPVINVLITGFYNDISVTPDTINVGIDYFVSKDNIYKPRDLPIYILDRYTPDFVVSTILSSYFSQFNIMDINDQTLLNEMIAFGKLYYVISELIPCTPKNIILGYSDLEWKTIEETEAFIYSFFIQNELFFEKNQLIKNKYINERPSVYEISPKHPGRIARWLGWKIVSDYMNKNKQKSLETLLYEKNYMEIFNESNYKPL